MKNVLIIFCSLLILAGVFGADEVNVSVMEGDSVTLEIKSEEIKGANLLWKFNTDSYIIAQINLEVNNRSVNYTDDERFRDRLKLDPQTGSLTITNITAKDSGEYKLEIRGSRGITYKTFRVSVSGEEKKSVMEGDDVTLHTDDTRLQTEDVVQWRFKDALIAHSNKTTKSIPYNDTDGKYKDRLDVNLSGSLKINNIRSEDSGVYEVNITGSKIIHKRFNVTVSVSSGVKTGPGLLVLLLMGFIVTL